MDVKANSGYNKKHIIKDSKKHFHFRSFIILIDKIMRKNTVRMINKDVAIENI